MILEIVAGCGYIVTDTPCGFDRRARGLFGGPCFFWGGNRCVRLSTLSGRSDGSLKAFCRTKPEAWSQGALRDRIGLMHLDTIAIIVAILGVGLALWRAMDSRHKDIRQDMAGLRQAIKETNARIDTLEGRLSARIDAMDNRIDTMEGRLNARIDALDDRIDALEGRLNARIDALYQGLFSRKDPAA